MIGFLKGKVLLKDGLHIIIDTGGVGYKVLVSEKIWAKANLKDEIQLFIYTHVRDDEISLFGFADALDLKLFESLITVSGVGPKTAMSLFSFSERSEIISSVMKGDVEFFTAVPRLGRKNAQKIIIELKNKFGDKGEIDLSTNGESSEVVSALKSFGFSTREIMDALRNVSSVESPEEKIRLALKYLGK